jgi:hypothetical protein
MFIRLIRVFGLQSLVNLDEPGFLDIALPQPTLCSYDGPGWQL